MSLIPRITLEELNRLIQNGGIIRSAEIFSNDKYIGTFIVPSMLGGITIFDEIRINAEYLGVRGNIVLPPEEEPSKDEKLHCDECDFSTTYPIALAGHRRKHKVKV